MESFTLAYQMAKTYVKSDDITLEKAFQILDELVKTSWHIWLTAEYYRDTMKEAVSISNEMKQCGITNFKLDGFTVDLWENDEGFGYSLYPYNAEPDEDGNFNEDVLIDGGEIECNTLACALEYIDTEIINRKAA